jgi:hypothetical protein
MSANTQLRRAMITINNLSDGEVIKDEVWSCEWAVNRVKRWVYQIEKGEPSGVLHAQIYVEFKDKAKFSTIKNWLNGEGYIDQKAPHIEPPRTSTSICYNYCTKEDTRVLGPFEGGDWGNKAGQGRRTDLDDVIEMVKKKRPFREIAEQHPTTVKKYHKGIIALRDALQEDERPNTWKDYHNSNKWIWGPSGVGKTTYAYTGYAQEEVYSKNPTQWWNGFDINQHKVIVFDDYRPKPGGFGYRDFITLAQPFGLHVETKGGMIKMGNQPIIVTSNQSPEELFRHQKDMLPLLSRFEIIHMDFENTTTTVTTVGEDGVVSKKITSVKTNTINPSLL